MYTITVGIQNYYFHMCVQIAHYMMLKGNYSPVSLVFVGIELRRVKSSLFCHIECLYEFKCKRLFSCVSAIVIFHFLTLEQFIIFLLSCLSITKLFTQFRFRKFLGICLQLGAGASCHTGVEGMLWWMLMCSGENVEWRTLLAIGSTAVLPYLLNYAFHSSSNLK